MMFSNVLQCLGLHILIYRTQTQENVACVEFMWCMTLKEEKEISKQSRAITVL